MIDINYKLRPGDVLEFISPIGSKGLGKLLTADDIMSQWSIDTQQYEELLVAGLKIKKERLNKFSDCTKRK